MYVGPWSEFLQYKQQRGVGIRLASLEATGPILPQFGEPLPGSPRAVDQSALSPTFQAGISSGSTSLRRPAPPVLGSVVRSRVETAGAAAEEGGARGLGRASHASTQRARMEAMRALYSGTSGSAEVDEAPPPPALWLQGESGSAAREAHLLSLLHEQAAAIAALTAGQARLTDAVELLLQERAQAVVSASAPSPHSSPAHRRPPPPVTSVLDDLSPGPELRAALEAAVGEGEEEEDWGGMLPTGEIAWVSEVDRLQELFKRKPGR